LKLELLPSCHLRANLIAKNRRQLADEDEGKLWTLAVAVFTFTLLSFPGTNHAAWRAANSARIELTSHEFDFVCTVAST